ncbi:MAG: PAS domain-containing protein, partial [Cyanobacteria bacterium P01_C01_bin.38]
MTLPMNPNVLTDNSGNSLSQILLEIINSVSDPIFVKNRQHEWIFVNNAFCQLMGYAPEELTGKSEYDFFNTEEANIFREKNELIFTSELSSDSEGYFTDTEGRVHVIKTKKSLFNDDSGNQFLINTIKEIKASENKQQD